jgi:hypothetical protein
VLSGFAGPDSGFLAADETLMQNQNWVSMIGRKGVLNATLRRHLGMMII